MLTAFDAMPSDMVAGIAARWLGATVRCVRCSSDALYYLSLRNILECGKCGKQFGPTTGTPVQWCKLPARRLLEAWIDFHSGLNAYQVHKRRALNYRTAHRLKVLFAKADQSPKGGDEGSVHDSGGPKDLPETLSETPIPPSPGAEQ